MITILGEWKFFFLVSGWEVWGKIEHGFTLWSIKTNNEYWEYKNY